MKRRTLLAALGSTAAVGLAGCTGVDCDKFHSGNTEKQVVTASREALFIEPNTRPQQISNVEQKLVEIENRIRPSQPIGIGEANDDGYGPYHGFFVYQNRSKGAVKQAFKDAGIGINNDWWDWEIPHDWANVKGLLIDRQRTINNDFTASETESTPTTFQFEATNNGDAGERSAFLFPSDAKEWEMKDTVWMVGGSGGIGLEPVAPDSSTDITYGWASNYTTDIDVVAQGDGYELQVTLGGPEFRDYADSLPDDASSLALLVPGNAVPAVSLEDGVQDEMVATDLLTNWDEAAQSATTLMHEAESPVFASFPADSCGG